MQPVIQIEGLCKQFGRQPVLDQVSLSVPPGVVFALLGENGAGKTTLIRTLLGYHRADSGTIRVLGMNPAREALQLRQRIGFVSDAHDQYEWMTVGETGWFASGFYPDGFQRRFASLASGFELPLDRRLKDLSKGMRAKVSLALALAFDPELLIMDEPTSGLDPLVRRSFLEEMIERAAGGKTVFLSSHQIHEVERVADWVAILCGGKLRMVAPLEDLKQNLSRIEIAQRDSLIALPAVMGDLEIVAASQAGRRWDLIVRGDARAAVAACNGDENVLEATLHRPTLEELYLALAGKGNAAVPVASPVGAGS